MVSPYSIPFSSSQELWSEIAQRGDRIIRISDIGNSLLDSSSRCWWDGPTRSVGHARMQKRGKEKLDACPLRTEPKKRTGRLPQNRATSKRKDETIQSKPRLWLHHGSQYEDILMFCSYSISQLTHSTISDTPVSSPQS